jgi:hypothetical protein
VGSVLPEGNRASTLPDIPKGNLGALSISKIDLYSGDKAQGDDSRDPKDPENVGDEDNVIPRQRVTLAGEL